MSTRQTPPGPAPGESRGRRTSPSRRGNARRFNRWNVLFSLPSVAVAAAMIGLPLVSNARLSTQHRYEVWATAHRRRAEYPALFVCLKRLLTLDPWRPEIIFSLAQAYEGMGDPDRAEALARSLAPEDQTGYEPARRWLVTRGLNRPTPETPATPDPGPDESAPVAQAEKRETGDAGPVRTNPPDEPKGSVAGPPPAPPAGATTPKDRDPAAAGPGAAVLAEKADAIRRGQGATVDALRRRSVGRVDSLREAEAQLQQLLREHPDSADVKVMLGMLYAETGRHADACRILDPVAENYPVIQLTLAKCCLALGDRAGWLRYLKEARGSAGRVVRERPDDPAARSVWVTACLSLGDYESALDVLAKNGTASTSAARQRERAYVCAAWADTMNRSGKAKTPALLGVVERGLGYDPANEALLTDLAGLLTKGGDASSEAHAAVRSMLGNDRLAAPARYALGMEAWVGGRPAEARRQWAGAYAINPDIPVLANNLATCLISTAPADPAKALVMIDRALVRTNGDARMRLTRGQVLCKLNRWREAADELEKARAGGENGEDLRRALAETYAHLGRAGQAGGRRARAPTTP